MRTWDLEAPEPLASDGAWLEYGAYGDGTYGLHCEIDGAAVTACVRAGSDWEAAMAADTLLDRLADGWRPVNWRRGARR